MEEKRILAQIILFWLVVIFSEAPYVCADRFIPIGTGTFHVYRGVPFQIDGVYIRVDTLYETSDIMLLGGQIANRIHILQTSGYAANVPGWTIVGHILVYYEDGASEVMDLIAGENTAEWAYERIEVACCLAHPKVEPAYSWWTGLDSASHYRGHIFYVSMDLEARPLDRLELALCEDAYTDQPPCPPPPCEQTDPERYSILITAVTLEVPE